MDSLRFFLQRYKDHLLVCFLIWLMMTLMFVESSFGDDFYVDRNLVYFWDFNNEFSFEADRKVNADAFLQGKVRWVPPKFSFNDSGVIHIHGDKNPASFFLIPSYMTKKDFSDWTLDFEFACWMQVHIFLSYIPIPPQFL